MSRSYDQWKTEAPQYNDDVTSCCGSEEVESNRSNCCDSKFWAETDICGECKEHADEYMICSDCGDDEETYTMIKQFEYDERMQERYSDTGEH